MAHEQTEKVEQWLAIRKEAALTIDPQTAEVMWCYAQTLDPYGVHPDLPEDCRQVGREYFARSPGSDVWVSFDDLPEKVLRELWERHTSKLAFPAGLEELWPLLERRLAGDVIDEAGLSARPKAAKPPPR